MNIIVLPLVLAVAIFWLYAESLLKQGQTNIVIRAFENYSSIAATDSTFRASERMMHDLKSGQTN
jgi:hypothetical protein